MRATAPNDFARHTVALTASLSFSYHMKNKVVNLMCLCVGLLLLFATLCLCTEPDVCYAWWLENSDYVFLRSFADNRIQHTHMLLV